MDRDKILQQLREERGRLDQAISALEGGNSTRRVGRPAGRAKKKTGGITPEGRRKLSEMMRKRWAARRKAAKK